MITAMSEQVEESVDTVVKSTRHLYKDLLLRYIPSLPTIPLEQGIRRVPSWKSLPNYAVNKVSLLLVAPYLDFPVELRVFGSLLRFIHSNKGRTILPFSSMAY